MRKIELSKASLGLVCIWFVVSLSFTLLLSENVNKIIYFIILFFTLPLLTLFHEGGHGIAGLLVGGKPANISFKSLKVTVTVNFPEDGKSRHFKKMFICVAGPFTDLLIALLAINLLDNGLGVAIFIWKISSFLTNLFLPMESADGYQAFKFFKEGLAQFLSKTILKSETISSSKL